MQSKCQLFERVLSLLIFGIFGGMLCAVPLFYTAVASVASFWEKIAMMFSQASPRVRVIT